ncbi:peptidoglycan D,D-transpeptidase FtsI family protein [Nocardia mexicana]|uniref:Cell division protein FtsI (Penicillin-binding protein 3) n=1 Tax=Nocardia mexicana TaxID=279262 RepID=A0A370H6S4_9NOCA|nr:penicillin-binding protein 2 [Nocardia mexicana]RDI49861.1 cell division protein FtsI (penicillin-binding protein 3) [Nocardia mexicana]
MSSARGRSTSSRRAPARPRKRARPGTAADATFRLRFGVGRILMLVALLLVAAQLLWVQTIAAPKLSAEAANQRTVHIADDAMRGPITDRNGKSLAFTVATKALTFQPVEVRKQLAEARAKSAKAPDPDQRLQAIAKMIHEKLGKDGPKESDLLGMMRSEDKFTYLARNVDARIASEIKEKFPEVGTDRQPSRIYPGGSLAANVIGATGWDGHGAIGLESSMDSELAGTDGSHTYDQGSDGAVIPGSERDRQPAVNGSAVELTLDSDLQYYVQQQVQQAKQMSQAQDASAVVLDAHTGQVLAMANDNTFNPQLGPKNWGAPNMGNPSVTDAFEPGSVNKVVTAASAIEYGLTTPDEVHQVPGAISMGGVTVNDAWPHGVTPFTTTGIFGKSSNVGTLMLSQRVGEDRYAEMLKRFGLGQRTGVGLPGESGGVVPSRDQWSGSTFANLPIGQGLSMTLLQMTGMYQAIANDGVRIPPRIVKSEIGPDGSRTDEEQPEGVRVVSPQTARTLRTMFQSVVQHDPTGVQQGTGPSGGIEGYQIAGKTGTAQQIDQACRCYSADRYWITFAGIAPADNPRYVVGIMLNAPTRSADGSGGQSAAPLFHSIASWALQRDRIPPSPPAKPLVLQEM